MFAVQLVAMYTIPGFPKMVGCRIHHDHERIINTYNCKNIYFYRCQTSKDIFSDTYLNKYKVVMVFIDTRQLNT